MKHALIALFLSATAATAQTSDIAQAELLPGWRTAEGTQMAGLRITLAPGWKTYWRAPGDSGIPPQFNWGGSANITGAQLHWPVPEVFSAGGQRSIGYHDSVVIPIEFATGTGAATVQGVVELGVCEEICVPVTLSFTATLPPDGRRTPEIVAALVDRPQTQAEAGVTTVTCTLTPLADGMTVTARITGGNTTAQDVVIIETSDPTQWVSAADVTQDGGALVATADIVPSVRGAFAVDRAGLRFTVLGAHRAIDIRGCTAG